jgi:hypothetical protein
VEKPNPSASAVTRAMTAPLIHAHESGIERPGKRSLPLNNCGRAVYIGDTAGNHWLSRGGHLVAAIFALAVFCVRVAGAPYAVAHRRMRQKTLA